MKTRNAELLLLLITIIWGATFSFTKIGLEHAQPFQFTTFRFGLALLISFIIWWKIFFKISRKNLFYGLILGFFYAGGFILQTLGLQYTTVTKSAFITGLSVALTPFAYKFLEKKNISIYQWIGIVIVVIGLYFFTNPEFGNFNIGDLLTLFSTFFWAFYLVYMNRFTIDIHNFSETIQLVISQFILVFIASIIGAMLFENWHNIQINNKLLIALIYNGIIASIILTSIHTSVQKFTTPVKAALIFSLEPVFASIFALFFFNEILKAIEYLGAFLILFGVLVSEFGSLVFSFLQFRVERNNPKKNQTNLRF